MQNKLYVRGLAERANLTEKKDSFRDAYVRVWSGRNFSDQDVMDVILKWDESYEAAVDGMQENFCEIKRLERKRRRLLDRPEIPMVLKRMLRVSHLNLYPEVEDTLLNHGIRKVSGLCALTEEDLTKGMGIEDAGVENVRDTLSNYGLTLKGETWDAANWKY